jgi:CIC family chloride channel protein
MALLIFFPSLFGEGYESIKLLEANKASEIFKNSLFHFDDLSNWGLLIVLGLVMFVKVYATSATLGCGGVGGNFAPSLFMGAYVGFAFALLFQLIGVSLPISNFTLVAMGGILSGIFHAPLTGIFLIAEISGGYSLIVPLMIVSTISYLLVKYAHTDSMDVRKLKKTGTIVSEDKDTSILGRIEVADLIETDFATLNPDQTLGDVIEQIKHSRRNVFPVVNKKNLLVGLVQLDDIREEIFNPKLYSQISVKEIMEKPSAKISVTDNIFLVMKKFEDTAQWSLPVVKEGIYLGFLSKSSILSRYRSELISYYN